MANSFAAHGDTEVLSMSERVNPAELRVGQVVKANHIFGHAPLLMRIVELNFAWEDDPAPFAATCIVVTKTGRISRTWGKVIRVVPANEIISIISQPQEVSAHV